MNKPMEDLEINILKCRIVSCLDQCYDVLKIALSLKHLIEDNEKLIKKLFPEDTSKKIFYTVLKYLDNQNDSVCSFTSRSNKTKTISDDEMHEQKIDPALSDVIHLLHSKVEIRTIAAEYCETAKPNIKKFLSLINELKNVVEKKLSMSAMKERQYKYELEDTWERNNYFKTKINELNEEYKTKCSKSCAEMEILNDTWIKLGQQMQERKDSCYIDMHKIMNKSELTMSADTEASKRRQEDLSKQLKEVGDQYERLLELNLKQEKTLRANRFKIETRLSNWIAKYDTEVGNLQEELENLTEGFETEKSAFEELQLQFNEQEEVYKELMNEKEEEEKIIFEAKCFKFIQNRSARRIQRWWRNILSKRRLKKKARKGKGKK